MRRCGQCGGARAAAGGVGAAPAAPRPRLAPQPAAGGQHQHHHRQHHGQCCGAAAAPLLQRLAGHSAATRCRGRALPPARSTSNGSSAATTAATAAAEPAAAEPEAAASAAAEAGAAPPAADAGSGAAQAAAAAQWAEEIEETLKLVRLLPPGVRSVLEGHPQLHELLEVVMDLGRPPLARLPGRDEALSDTPVSQADLEYACAQVGEFGGDNRAGIDATLHRISCLRNRSGRIVGLTCRVGRAILGSAGLVADLVGGGASVLFMGRPGVGKTTAIRELSRLLADDAGRRVVIVDTSNELGGDGDVPHAGIGRARRMQVPDPSQQHRIMIEAVENHMPQVVVIDEIGTEAEASAARTIAQRGVQLVATAHGNELHNLIKNPALSDLVGGIQSVTLGDDEAKRRGVQKSVLERAAPPTFDVAVEMHERGRWRVYADVAAAVDALLAGHEPRSQMRSRAPDGTITTYTPSTGGGGGGSSGGGEAGGRVLPDLLLRAGGAGSGGSGGNGGAAAAAGEAAGQQQRGAGGFVVPRVDSPGPGPGASGTVTRRGRSVRLGCESPAGALLRLHVAELDEERLWEVMTAMALHDKVYLAPRPAEADAVLAVRGRLRTNTALRAAARAAGVPVYAIKSSSSSNLVRAFRTLLGLEPSAGGLFGSRGGSMDEDGGAGAGSGQLGGSAATDSLDGLAGGSSSSGDDTDDDELSASSSSSASPPPPRRASGPLKALQQEEDGLEEARLAVEQIVMPLQQPVELLPRSEHVRKAQAAMCGRYGLLAEVVGTGDEARVRVCPRPAVPAAVAASAAGGGGSSQHGGEGGEP